LDAERVRLIASVDRHGDAQAAGHVNTRAFLHRECAVAKGSAGRDVRAARRLREFPEWKAAFAAGCVTRDHVDVLVKAATAERAGRLAEHEHDLLTHATHFPPESFRTLVGHACELIDDDLGAAGAWEHYQSRALYVSTTLDSVGILDGRLAPETNALLNAVLEQYMASDPDRHDQPRTVAQRRHDALHLVARDAQACTCRADTSKPRGLAAVTVAVDLDALQGHADLKAHVRAEAEHAGRLPTATLRRLTCDAGISRVLTAGRSEILDVGRTTRTIPTALWRALVIRDRGCKTCGASPARCQVHHIQHWANGGNTSLANTELRCHHCHTLAHEGTGRGP
jgi:hypothetical protein